MELHTFPPLFLDCLAASIKTKFLFTQHNHEKETPLFHKQSLHLYAHCISLLHKTGGNSLGSSKKKKSKSHPYI